MIAQKFFEPINLSKDYKIITYVKLNLKTIEEQIRSLHTAGHIKVVGDREHGKGLSLQRTLLALAVELDSSNQDLWFQLDVRE